MDGEHERSATLEGEVASLRVAEWVDGYFPAVGGGASAIRSWIDGMPDVEFEVVTNRLPGTPEVERSAPNCTVRRVLPVDVGPAAVKPGVKLARYPIKLWHDHVRFRRKLAYVAQANPDLFHFNGPLTNYGHFSFDRRIGHPLLTRSIDFGPLGMPKVLTMHGIPSRLTRSRVDVENERRQITAFDAIVVVDRYMVGAVRAIASAAGARSEVHLIPNSVDTRRFSYRPLADARGLKVGYIGRLNPSKGVGLLREIARQLPDGVELSIVSSGPPDAALDGFFTGCPHVTLARNLPYEEVPGFLSEIDVLLNLALHPAITRATLEAMSVGRPVIMPPIGDRYPLINRRTGFLCAPNAREILSLLAWARDEGQLLEQMGRNAREVVEREFDHVVLGARLRSVFEATRVRGG